MKKNKMMRVASALLVAVLLTSCAISGTFAKYVTKETASDTARVAKWGVYFDIEGGPLFSTTYATDDNTNYASMSNSVKSDAQVVAPGTEGKLVTFRTKGTPEVSYKVTFDINTNAVETIFTNKTAEVKSDYTGFNTMEIPGGYYPVKFTVNWNGKAILTDATNMDNIVSEIKALSYYFNVDDGKYYVGEKAQESAPELSIIWKWDFENNDVADTTLGNMAAGFEFAGTTMKNAVGTEGTDYNLEIAFNLTATATQIN